MNDITIETILFHAPPPAAPPELLKRIQAQIELRPGKAEAKKNGNWRNSLRRWFPALAFSLFLLSCAVMIAVQGSWNVTLKRQKQVLQTAIAGLPQLREQHAALEQVLAQQDELDQLRKDNREVQQLRKEVAQLQSLAGQMQRLQDENQRLAKTLSAPAAAPETVESFFDEAQQRTELIQCINNLKQLGLAMRIWAGDNNDKYPTSLVVMSNELSVVKILICPGDKARQSYSSLSFGEFRDDMTSYQYLAQPNDENYPDCVVAFCPIHHLYLFADGSVKEINPASWREIKKDGRLYLEPINPDSAK
jgi:hypothetical protein